MSDGMEEALAIIKRWEGCELTAYPDPGTGGHPWTIGYGATGPGIRKGVVWTQAEADARVAEDVRRFHRGVLASLKRQANRHQMAAMTSLAFNIGLGAFTKSTLLRRFNEGKFQAAAAEFDRWVRAGGRVMPGLVGRRRDERALFETPDFSLVRSGVTSTERML